MLKAIAFEPENGWYKDDTDVSIDRAIEVLREKGVDDETIEDVIEDLISTIMNEYGE